MKHNTKRWIQIRSDDLEQKIVTAFEKRENSYQQLSKRFSVSLSFIQNLITSGVIATTAVFGSFAAEVQAATFTLPIEPAAKATGVDVLRDRYGLDGSGITIGIISDSFATANTFDPSGNLDTYATNIASGYLPSGINVLRDYAEPDATDEGRAIAQVIHAVAPGANLAFYTSEGGVDVFGQGIQALASAGANIIVDDRGYVPESVPNVPSEFLDQEPPNGPINQAINAVVNQGVSYFSSAGNSNFPPNSEMPSLPIYGHANNPNALTVGAVYYGNAESYFNRPYNTVVEQGQLEPFSSRGNPGSFKPDVVAPDALAISFGLEEDAPRLVNPGFFDFFGTSASAPFTAGVAALLLEANPSATPTDIYDAFRDTALHPSSGFDSGLGFGLIQGDKAFTVLNTKLQPDRKTIPEPSAVPALLCVSVFITGLVIKRTQQSSKAKVKPNRSLTLLM